MAQRRIDFVSLEVGGKYDRKELAAAWGYESFHALARGLVAPKGTNYLIMFITRERQSYDTPYQNTLAGHTLYCDGPLDHFCEDRVIKSKVSDDEIHVFYRELHRERFTYEGRFELTEAYKYSDSPSKFVLSRHVSSRVAYDAEQANESILNIVPDDGFDEDNDGLQFAEGGRVTYETTRVRRSGTARNRCILKHGVKCIVCGFDFEEVYGDIGAGYIQVHHLSPISESVEPRIVDPIEDLRPVCPNCHAMLHRSNTILSIDELRARLRKRRMS